MVTISRSLIKARWQATKAATKVRKMAAIMGGLDLIEFEVCDATHAVLWPEDIQLL